MAAAFLLTMDMRKNKQKWQEIRLQF